MRSRLARLGVALTALATSAAASAADEPSALRFLAGPPRLEELRPRRNGNRFKTWDAYREFAARFAQSSWFVAVRELPKEPRPLVGLGTVRIADQEVGFAVFGSRREEHVLYVDTNADGSLRDEAVVPLAERGGNGVAVIEQPVELQVGDETVPSEARLRFLLIERAEGTGDLVEWAVLARTFRDGEIVIGGRRAAFRLTGRAGRYDRSSSEAWVDLDGDGAGFDTPGSPERLRPQEGLNMGDASYRLDIDPAGRWLSLAPLEQRLPDRPSLVVGASAPSFAAQDLDGRGWKLGDHAGQVVLLVFWDRWCGACREEAPELADLHERYGSSGLVVLGISTDEPAVIRETAREWRQDWPQIPDADDGPLHRLFRVVRYPTYFLIDRDGRILETEDAGLYAIEEDLSRMMGHTVP